MSSTSDRPETIPHPSPNHDARGGQAVDILLLHYTGMESGPAALARLCDPAAKVSAHYLIEEDGRIYDLVPESRRAWHAGQSSFEGRERCNDFSIGIELEGTDDLPYTDIQYERLAAITRDLMRAWPGITSDRIVGHSDVAPGRKTDPGPAFDWARLRAAL